MLLQLNLSSSCGVPCNLLHQNLRSSLVTQVEKMQHRKRKGEDSPEGRRHKRHAMEYGYHAVNYDSPQRMQRGGAGQLPPRAVGGSPAGRPAGKSSSKSHGSPLGRTDKVYSFAQLTVCEV